MSVHWGGRGPGHLSRKTSAGTPTPTYTAEAIALFARFSSQPDDTRKGVINDLIVALKAAGVWSKLDALYVMAAHDAQAAQRNWIADSFNLTPTLSPTFTTDRGYAGNGTSSYLDTGFNPTTASSPKFVLNSSCISLWSRSSGQQLEADAGQGVNPGVRLVCRDTADLSRFAMNSPTTGIGNSATFPCTDGSGHFCWNRSGATTADTQAYRNGAGQTLTGPDASTALANANITIGRYGTGYNSREFAGGSIGQSINATEVLNFYNAFATYMTAVGA